MPSIEKWKRRLMRYYPRIKRGKFQEGDTIQTLKIKQDRDH